MRRLIMWNLVTLDGFFEGPFSWEIDWHDYVWGEELEQFSIEQSKSADMLLFGRVTYQGMAAYWASEKGEIADFMNNIPKIAFSRTLESRMEQYAAGQRERRAGSRETEAAARQGPVHLRQRQSLFDAHGAWPD